jgi:hypothetical protein
LHALQVDGVKNGEGIYIADSKYTECVKVIVGSIYETFKGKENQSNDEILGCILALHFDGQGEDSDGLYWMSFSLVGALSYIVCSSVIHLKLSRALPKRILRS